MQEGRVGCEMARLFAVGCGRTRSDALFVVGCAKNQFRAKPRSVDSKQTKAVKRVFSLQAKGYCYTVRATLYTNIFISPG